jgi:hypothetical protein
MDYQHEGLSHRREGLKNRSRLEGCSARFFSLPTAGTIGGDPQADSKGDRSDESVFSVVFVKQKIA